MEDPLANIANEVREFFATTSDEELDRIWNELQPEKYEGSISVSEYMEATQHLVKGSAGTTLAHDMVDEGPPTVTSLDVHITQALTFLISVPGRVHDTVSAKEAIYFVRIQTTV